ncbi:hypothetical protein, partial [Gilvibacter sp.]|uniref:hypothetical protein n=1 Tax=Gilvibacter sp. TaxID=2729997 RepID=UPI0035BE2649
GRLISESGVDDIYGRATDYTYEADALVVVEKTWTFPEGGTVIYKFESLNTDSPTMTLIGTNDIGETIEELFELTIEKDADDRITYYKQVSTETSETEEIIATYTGNNLTRLEFIPGDVYEMVYDDKKAPFYGRASFFAYGSVRMFGVPTEIFDGLWGKPFFSEFLNENNLIELRVNGSLELEYIYTYNEFDYPDTMINPQSSTGGDLRFRYEYLYIE